MGCITAIRLQPNNCRVRTRFFHGRGRQRDPRLHFGHSDCPRDSELFSQVDSHACRAPLPLQRAPCSENWASFRFDEPQRCYPPLVCGNEAENPELSLAKQSTSPKAGKVKRSKCSQTSCLGRESGRELSATGLRADLYSPFGVQRNLGHIRSNKPKEGFSATGRRVRFVKITANCDDFGSSRSYFSDNNDLLAEDAVRCEPFSAEIPC